MAPKSKQKIIIDGEIYDSLDDPRLLAKQQSQQNALRASQHIQSSRQSQPHGQEPRNAAQPLIRLVPNPGGFAGLPNVEILGRKLPPAAILFIAVLIYRLGWKALVMIAAGFYFLQMSQQGLQRPSARRQDHTRSHQSTASARPGASRASTGSGMDLQGTVGNILGSLGLTPNATENAGASRATGNADQRNSMVTGSPPSQRSESRSVASQEPSTGSAFAGKGYKLGSKD